MEWSNDSSSPALAQSVPLRSFGAPARRVFPDHLINFTPRRYPLICFPLIVLYCPSARGRLHSGSVGDDDHSGRPSAMPTMSRECEAISKELQDRYELDDELDLKEIAPLMLQLREALPPASFKFLLTLCESVFSKLDPDLVQVPVMKKKLEAALAAQAKTLGRRGGEDAATEPPDRL